MAKFKRKEQEGISSYSETPVKSIMKKVLLNDFF